jgi:molybdate transport system regulatory protein
VPASIKHIIKKKFSYKVTGSLWIECNAERFLGPGKVELLERIADTGSINKAAKQMGMSYKKAWGMINSLNAQTIKPVVIPRTGGKKGGGSTITEEARQLIKFHRQLRERFAAFLEKETNRLEV